MKMMRVLATALFGSVLMASVAQASVEDDISARIEPVGTVCVQGEDCGDIATAAAPSASEGPRSGEEVYTAVCSACHGSGVMGAPKFGDAGSWAPHVAKGIDTLIDNAINGINAMPAKGGCASCPDEEIEAAVHHMVDNSK